MTVSPVAPVLDVLQDGELDPLARAYRAAVVHEFGSPLSVEEVAPAALAAGQVRVRVEATGLCHTDIHAANGDWPVKPSPPFVSGHDSAAEPRVSRGGRASGGWARRDSPRAARR